MTTDPNSSPAPDLTPFLSGLPAGPVSWADLFGNDRPVELEVGPGKGLFLVNAARRDPSRNFVGVELAHKYARKAAERVAKNGLENVRVFSGDARRFVRELVPSGSLHALHVYFPDPWWKKRHKKRRVFTDEFVSDVARLLRPGGDFWIATDVEDYYQVMLEILASHPEFLPMPAPEPNTPEHDLDYLTNFERKYRIEGRPIHRAHYRLADRGGEA
jgi:tRNA (guanine-N7-)-methyltransferase